MLLSNLIFFMLSLAGTLSSAQPYCPNPGSADNVGIRNINGASDVFFHDWVVVTITQAYVEPTTRYPWGGVLVNLTNTYCYRVRVTFTLENGHHYSFSVPAGQHNLRNMVPEGVRVGHSMRISVEMDTGT
jgi:hypothetical protein